MTVTPRAGEIVPYRATERVVFWSIPPKWPVSCQQASQAPAELRAALLQDGRPPGGNPRQTWLNWTPATASAKPVPSGWGFRSGEIPSRVPPFNPNGPPQRAPWTNHRAPQAPQGIGLFAHG